MELDEELSCPICSEYYREAITVPCGHTFCRECLIKSTREKPVCPVCRSIFLSAARDMKENITISNIVRRVKGRNSQHEPVPEPRKRSVQGTQQSLSEGIVTKKKVQNKILVKVQSRELLLPYLKCRVKMKLEPSLREQLRNFVVVQDIPYVKYAVEGKMNSLMATDDENIFEGVFEGICFFEVLEEKLVQYEQDGQPLEVKVCSGYELKEESKLSIRDFDYFFSVFDRLPHPYLINSVFTRIDQNVIVNRQNLTGISYSALAIIRITDQQRYELLTNFDEDQRIARIDQHLSRFALEDVIRNPSVAFKMDVPGNYSSTFLLVFILVMLFFYSYEFSFDGL